MRGWGLDLVCNSRAGVLCHASLCQVHGSSGGLFSYTLIAALHLATCHPLALLPGSQLYPACKIALELCDSLSWDFECVLAVQVRAW